MLADSLARRSAARGGWMLAGCTSIAGAQSQTWIRQFGTSDDELAAAAAADGAGGVFVTGYTTGSLGGPIAGMGDVWLARYDRPGNQAWIRQFGTVEWDEARAAEPDGSGGVYVSGITLGALVGPHAGSEDAWLARYDGAGNQVWIKTAVPPRTGPGRPRSRGGHHATRVVVAFSRRPRATRAGPASLPCRPTSR
jgi:hypothetical protein